MASITVTKSKDYFLKEGRPFFYLADTVWSAFTNISLSQWEQYLDFRQAQGFSALQITILPQWDRSQGYEHLQPFKGRGGRWDYTALNDEYFQKAREMVRMARDRALLPALVFLWCDCVPGTWASARIPGHEIPFEVIDSYAEYVVRNFTEFEPVYLISGDTDFKSPETEKTYLAALQAVKRHAPNALTTFHLSPDADLPEEIVRAEELDFYMYQSGHHIESQDRAYKLADKFDALPVKRPIVNGEPPYEGHGFGHRYGRFGAFHVRSAIWQSLLSGANAGVTYGAHGIWSWHDRDKVFPNAEFSSTPYPWHVALRFPGAWDAGFARSLFETYGLFGLEAQGSPNGASGEVRMAATPGRDKIAVYLPYATEITLEVDLSGYELLMIDLVERRVGRARYRIEGKGTRILLQDFNADTLFFAIR